jgi:hypothetical protein
MDKQKIKILLISLACVLAIFLIYKVIGKVADNKLEAQGKIDSFNADLENKKTLDVYTEQREQTGKSKEAEKVEMINEVQEAQGVMTLSDYLATLTDAEKETYQILRSNYIRVMGVDPGVMSLEDLSKWADMYDEWTDWNNLYLETTGSSKSILDPDFDTVDEIKAAVLSAQDMVNQMWHDEYLLFVNGRPELNLRGCPYITAADLQKWLPDPRDILDFQYEMQAQYDAFMNKYSEKQNTFKALQEYFNGGYINWKNSNHNFVRGALDLPEGTFQDLDRMNVNDCCLLTKLINDNGGVSIYSEVNSFNKPKEKKTWYNLLDASLAVANFQMAYQEGTNILAAIATAGISAAIQKNNKVRKYMPERLNRLMSRIEASATQHYTPFGFTLELAHWEPAYFSQRKYGFYDYMYDEIESGKMTIQEWVESDTYKKKFGLK